MRNQQRFLVVAVTALALMGLAVASSSFARVSEPVRATVGQAAPLTGKIWVVTSLSGKAPLRGTTLTSEFTSGKTVTGSSGCNHYNGTYTVSGSKLRIATPLTSTRKACAKAIERQEAGFQKALLSVRTYEVSGSTLTLRAAGGKAVLRYKAQTQQLAGTSWTVTAYNNGKEAVVSVLAGTKLTATFSKDGNVEGFAGCNNYNATYKATAPKITFGPIVSTQMHCAEPMGVSEQETAYLAALQTAATYRIDGKTLELRTSGGAMAVELQRK